MYRNKLPFWRKHSFADMSTVSLHHSMVSYFHIPSQCISRTLQCQHVFPPGAIHMCILSESTANWVFTGFRGHALGCTLSLCGGNNFQCLLPEIRLSHFYAPAQKYSITCICCNLLESLWGPASGFHHAQPWRTLHPRQADGYGYRMVYRGWSIQILSLCCLFWRY